MATTSRGDLSRSTPPPASRAALTERESREVASSPDSMVIVMACDENYAMPLATTLRSLVENSRNARSLDVVILTSHFSSDMKDRVLTSLPNESISLRWVPVKLEAFQGFSTRPYISSVTYARLVIPQFFAKTTSKVLYLDADILVTGSLAPLWDTDLEGALLGAISDTEADAHTQRLGLRSFSTGNISQAETAPEAATYFNAGVLLIDLERWRRERVSEVALDFMAQNPTSLLSDQDALNVACAGRWKRLSPRWNWQTHDPRGFSNMASESRPAIVHFAGRWKPWNPASLSPDAGLYDLFRSRTKFARTPADKVRDVVRYGCARLRDVLRQSKTLRTVYRFIANPTSAEMA